MHWGLGNDQCLLRQSKMNKLLLINAFLSIAALAQATQTGELQKQIINTLTNYAEQGIKSDRLKHYYAQLNDHGNEVTANPPICEACENTVDFVIYYRKSGKSRESMYNLLLYICLAVPERKLEDCKGDIGITLDTALYIIDNKVNLTGAHVCAIKLQTDGCKNPNAKKWSIDLPPYTDRQVQRERSSDATPMKVLHLTDIHYDNTYKPGTNAKCDGPLCCEESSGPPSKPENAAGYWGDYRVCDMPWHAVENVFDEFISRYNNFDLVYYTGDIISHKSWGTSKADNIATLKQVFNKFKATFGKQPVYPILGNHEPHPSDFYSPSNVTNLISTRWIFDLAVEEWADWLPANTKETLRKGGYYTVLLKPGFRIIGLNSNVCYNGNLWLVYEDEDPYDQLKWLVDVLTKAEKDSELVHILSHIPPGEPYCLQQWSHEYHKIVNRFANIIVGQFNGHTHFDELRVFYNMSNPKQVVNVAFNGGSFTTFVGLNPNYRVYEVDQSNYEVLDYEQWMYNLTEANLSPGKPPRWYKLYTFKDAYGLDKLSLDRYGLLLEKMAKNSTLVKEYVRFLVRESDAHSPACDDTCVRRNLCKLTAIESYDNLACNTA